MVTLEKLTNDWRIAVGSDSGLGDYTIKYDLRGKGFVYITRDTVSNEDKPADVVISVPLELAGSVARGTINPAVAMMRGKLKISPMSTAMKIQKPLEQLAKRMPEEGADEVADLGEEPLVDYPLPPRDSNMLLFEDEMFDWETENSYRPLEGRPGLLVRAIPAAAKYAEGKVTARVLRADPAVPFVAADAPDQSPGIATGYMVNGWARYDIEGLGEQRFEKGDFWSLPPRNAHRLIEVSSDFECAEFTFPQLTTYFKDGKPCTDSAADERYVSRLTPSSFDAIPNFDASVMRTFSIVKQMTGGAVNAFILKGNPPHMWVGSPWHMHHYEHFCTLFYKGTGNFEFEGVGSIDFKPGVFWYQQKRNRHKENLMSLDYEAIGFEIPAAYATTMWFYDEDDGEYKETVLEDVLNEAGEHLAMS